MPPIAEEMAGGTSNSLQVQQPKKKKSSTSHRPRQSPARKDDSEPHSPSPQQQQQQPQTSSATSRPRAQSVGSIGGETDDNLDEGEVGYTMLQVRSASVKPKTSAVSTMDHYSTDPNLATEFFKKEPCIYSHRMFVRASKIFAGLKSAREAKLEKRRPTKGVVVAGGLGPRPSDVSIEPLDFKNSKEMRLTYELAFSSLKYNSTDAERKRIHLEPKCGPQAAMIAAGPAYFHAELAN